MKDKKGFTLIEVMGVIILLGIIATIAVPTVERYVTSSREKSYETTIYKIIEAARNWNIKYGPSDWQEREDGSNFYELQLDDLKQTEFLSNGNYKNPITGENMDGCILIVRSVEDSYIYNYYEGCVYSAESIDRVNLTYTGNTLNVVVNVKTSGNTNGLKYYYSLNGGEYIESNNNLFSFENVDLSIENSVNVYVENISGEKSSPKSNTIISQDIIPTTYAMNTTGTEETYKTSKEVVVTFDNNARLTRYIKSSVNATTNVDTLSSCGNGEAPSTCSTLITKNINANTWYMVSGNINVKYLENGILYTYVINGDNNDNSTYTITNVDSIAPKCYLSVDSNLMKATPEDSESGIKEFNLAMSTPSGTYNNTSSLAIQAAGTYYEYVKDKAGNTANCSASVVAASPIYKEYTLTCTEVAGTPTYALANSQTVEASTCTANTFTCNATNKGKTYVTCSSAQYYYYKTTYKCEGTENGATYAFGSESKQSGLSSCTPSTITCDASHVNQNNVTCAASYTKTTSTCSCNGNSNNCSWKDGSATTTTSCTPSTGTKPTCNKSNKNATWTTCATTYTKTSKTCTKQATMSYENVVVTGEDNLKTCTDSSITCNASNVNKTSITCTPTTKYYTVTSQVCNETINHSYEMKKTSKTTACSSKVTPSSTCTASNVGQVYTGCEATTETSCGSTYNKVASTNFCYKLN